MENTNRVSQNQNGWEFSYYCQGYYFNFSVGYFSIGYFAFTNQIEYWRSFVKNLNDDHLDMKYIL